MALIDKLTNIADTIRNKNGSTDKLTLDEMVTAIESMNLGASIERGSFKPTSDIKTKKIAWSKTYDNPPVLFVYDTTYSDAGAYGDRHRCGYIINFKTLGWDTFMGQSSYNDLGHIISSWEKSPWSSAIMPAPIGWLTKSGGTLGSEDQINVSSWKWASGWTYNWIAVFL